MLETNEKPRFGGYAPRVPCAKPRRPAWMCWLPTLATAFALTACAAAQGVVDHAFSFDMSRDDQDAEVMDYRYGDSKLATARNPEYLLKEGRSLQSANIMGPMKRGDFLYVKWRIKSNGQMYEDTVALDQRLPADIKDHRIYFLVRGAQLYVYLISPERRAADTPPNGPSVYNYLRTTTIYPDQPRP